jgi:hypothetical protein
MKDLERLNAMDLLRSGYSYVRVENIPPGAKESSIPLQVIGPGYKVPPFHLNVGINPTFLLKKGQEFGYAVVNGFLIDLSNGKGDFGNAMIYKK